MPGYHGKFVWYELMTSDPDAAQRFYHDVVGWEMRDAGMPDMRYTLLHAGEAGVGGLMAIPEEARKMGARPGWTGYIWADDVDAAAAQIAEAGGKVHRPPDDIPGVGRFAIVADPQGVIFALFKAGAEMQAQGEGKQAPQTGPGHAGWRELLTTDVEAAIGFYSKQFGWTKAEAFDMGPMGVYRLFAREGETLGGMMKKPDAVPATFWLYYFNTESIEAATKRIEKGGGKIAHGPMEVPGGQWIVQATDPQGALFALLGPKQ